jgi:Kyakuja-Dileera-Zisupton transposase
MKKRMEKEDFDRLEFSIGWPIIYVSADSSGIFHCFAHVFQCQALYSTRMIEGIGLPDGKGNERLWSLERHLIPSLCVATPGRRFQVLGEAFLFVAEDKNLSMGRTFLKSFKLAFGKIDKSEKQAQSNWLFKTGYSPEEIDEQAKSMCEFFKNPSAKTSRDVYGTVCETITAIVVLARFHKNWFNVPESVTKVHELNIILQIRSFSSGRIDLMGGVTVDSLRRDLLVHISSTPYRDIRDWISDENVPTQNYIDHAEDVWLTHLRYRRNEISAILVERKMELTEIRANRLGRDLHPAHPES